MGRSLIAIVVTSRQPLHDQAMDKGNGHAQPLRNLPQLVTADAVHLYGQPLAFGEARQSPLHPSQFLTGDQGLLRSWRIVPHRAFGFFHIAACDPIIAPCPAQGVDRQVADHPPQEAIGILDPILIFDRCKRYPGILYDIFGPGPITQDAGGIVNQRRALRRI